MIMVFCQNLILIPLLPKKNKNTKYVKNMCPLTHRTNAYKILAKMIDNRLSSVLEIVSKDESGFVKGHKICHNV